MVAAQNMGSPFTHSAHIYQGRYGQQAFDTSPKINEDPYDNSIFFQTKLCVGILHYLCGDKPGADVEGRDHQHPQDGRGALNAQ